MELTLSRTIIFVKDMVSMVAIFSVVVGVVTWMTEFQKDGYV